MIKTVNFNIKKNVLVFDDGGMTHSNPDGTGFKIDLKVYDRMLLLAKKNNIKIQIACSAAFFDIDNIAGLSLLNPECDKILKLFDDNKDFLEIWNHGLNHRYKNECTEFFSYKDGAISLEYQKEHLKLSQDIFKKVNISPNVFVPPGHAWEQNVTDKIAKEFGLNAIAIREFEKNSFKAWIKNPMQPYKMTWEKSQNINTLFRLGLGIAFDRVHFDEKVKHKMSNYITNRFPQSLLINRKLKLKYPVDHFFAHIQNLQDPNSVDYFDNAIKQIKELKR
jgi:hypothetical protein